MTQCCFVAGTHGLSGLSTTGGWHQWPSPFLTHMQGHGIEPYSRTHGFEWDTRLGFIGARKLTGWYTAGLALRDYFHPMHVDETCDHTDEVNIVAHSHGAQVAAFAAQAGLRIRTLITICSPVREDMMGVYTNARKNIRTWVAVSSQSWWRDRWFRWGQLFDGRWGTQRIQPQAHHNVRIPSMGHGDLMTKPSAFRWWVDAGLVQYLKD